MSRIATFAGLVAAALLTALPAGAGSLEIGPIRVQMIGPERTATLTVRNQPDRRVGDRLEVDGPRPAQAVLCDRDRADLHTTARDVHRVVKVGDPRLRRPVDRDLRARLQGNGAPRCAVPVRDVRAVDRHRARAGDRREGLRGKHRDPSDGEGRGHAEERERAPHDRATLGRAPGNRKRLARSHADTRVGEPPIEPDRAVPSSR